MTTTEQPAAPPAPETRWYSFSVDDTVSRLGVDPASGLGAGEVTGRLATYGRNEVATEPPPTMTMAFTVVALSAVNMGFVMRRERQVPWSAPLFPYLGWIMLGWALTIAAVETRALQRILDTVSLTGAQWLLVIGLSLISPLFVAIDKIIQVRRLDREQREHPFAGIATVSGA